MGTFTIWHALVVLIILLPIYGIYRLAKRAPPRSSTSHKGPVGVGGWLLLLVVGLMFLGPFFGASELNRVFMDLEAQNPTLPTVEKWSTFKSASWWTFFVVAVLSFYGGLGLATQRTTKAVARAKKVLWITGPGAAIAMGFVLPVLVFGESSLTPEGVGGLIGSIGVAAIWSAYLSRSKRVAATYGD